MGNFKLWSGIMNSLMQKDGRAPMSRKQLKRLRPKRTKPFAHHGYRGLPKNEMGTVGAIPAPTIDQVRNLERKYGQKLHVRLGVIHFASDGVLFDKEEAKLRQASG